MSEDYSTKDYSDYLKEIENRISNKNETTAKKTVAEKPKKKRRIFLVLRVHLFRLLAVVLALAVVLTVVFSLKSCNKSEKKEETKSVVAPKAVKIKEKEPNFPKYTDKSIEIQEGIDSSAVLFMDAQSYEVIAYRNADSRMFPASTTKVMTLLVAKENIKDLNDTFTMTYQITDPLYNAGATVAGFSSSEVLTMDDLFYGTILPSGGDGAIGLATKISGGEKEFADLMNKKAEKLGLKNTNFVNCTGLFDANHYSTAEDMAVILSSAIKNDYCKKVLSTQKYVTSKTDKHPEGLPLENTLFKYMYGTEPKGGATIVGGKTGFVNESGYCILSFGTGVSGKTYICVTLKGSSRWPAVYDQINLYSKYAK